MAELINQNIEIGKYNYLQLINFRNFNLWDVKRYTFNNNFSFDNVVRLKDILKPFKKYVSKDEMIKNKWRIISKINFGGELFLRKFEEINSYKGNLFIVPDNAIIYSKINVRHGCIYYHEKGKEPFGVSNEYPTYTLDKNEVNGYFLQKVLQSNVLKNLLNTKTSGISKARVKQNEFLDIEIPLPSLQEQNKIVNAFYQELKNADIQEQRAKELEKEIEEYLFERLGIELINLGTEKIVLNFVKFKEIREWGIDKILRGHQYSLLKSAKYENVKLSDAVLINPRTDFTELKNDDKISFIPMKCVSDDYGEVSYLKEGVKNLSKGYTKFQEDDLIWARITPCMENGKSAIVKGLLNKKGYGSTEFHVIRTKNETVSLEYIYHLLRMKLVRKDAVNHFTGSAGQQRVPKSYLENLIIPIPPLNIQTEINNYINKIKNEIKLLHKTAETNRIEAVKEFEKEVFSK